jgi:hypothetical protein
MGSLFPLFDQYRRDSGISGRIPRREGRQGLVLWEQRFITTIDPQLLTQVCYCEIDRAISHEYRLDLYYILPGYTVAGPNSWEDSIRFKSREFHWRWNRFLRDHLTGPALRGWRKGLSQAHNRLIFQGLWVQQGRVRGDLPGDDGIFKHESH